MKIVVTGGTGSIGRHLLPALTARGHEGVALTRQPRRRAPWMPAEIRLTEWDAHTPGPWTAELEGADGVVHLAGAGIFDRRWNEDVKRELHESRVASTRLLANAIRAAEAPPRVFVSASAVGFYGDTGDQRADESHEAGDDFLARLCVDWEREAQPVAERGVRVANPRIGIVLQREGGALAQLLPAFKAFAGGYFGNGRQWFPWIHVRDAVDGLLLPFEDDTLAGPYNLVAPGLATFREFCTALGELVGRPVWRIPSFAARLLIGEGSSALLASLRITPRKLLDRGFPFRYPLVEGALLALLEE